jgi:hypothetical protein
VNQEQISARPLRPSGLSWTVVWCVMTMGWPANFRTVSCWFWMRWLIPFLCHELEGSKFSLDLETPLSRETRLGHNFQRW